MFFSFLKLISVDYELKHSFKQIISALNRDRLVGITRIADFQIARQLLTSENIGNKILLAYGRSLILSLSFLVYINQNVNLSSNHLPVTENKTRYHEQERKH